MTGPALLLCAALLAPGGRPPAPAPLPPSGAAERARRLQALLGWIHGAPPPEEWRALGPEAEPELLRLARDPAALPGRRAAALEGLSHLGGPLAPAALPALARDGALPCTVRAAALEGAGRLLPAAEAQALLLPVLRDAPRACDRAVAAGVLAAVDPAACPAVRAQAGREPAARRPALDGALARCAAAGR